MRADTYLFKYGYAESRKRAHDHIESGAVTVDGILIKKPSEDIDEGVGHSVCVTATEKYVSRGGLKLEKALCVFRVDVKGLRCIDIGASTGGFTDCLLQNGAAHVCAVDSGRGQLHPKILKDERVESHEGLNARELDPRKVGDGFDLAVMDVSFISQTLILPALSGGILREGGELLTLIKPQFEAGKSAVGKKGIVKIPAHRRAAVERVVDSAAALGFGLEGLDVSPITGGDGNVEYLAHFRYSGGAVTDSGDVACAMIDGLFKKG